MNVGAEEREAGREENEEGRDIEREGTVVLQAHFIKHLLARTKEDISK